MNISQKLLITWGGIMGLIFAYGFIEIEMLEIHIRWILYSGWMIVSVVGGLIWLWTKNGRIGRE